MALYGHGGYNGDGQLGDGTYTDRTSSVLVSSYNVRLPFAVTGAATKRDQPAFSHTQRHGKRQRCVNNGMVRLRDGSVVLAPGHPPPSQWMV